MKVPEGMDLLGIALKVKPGFAVDDVLTSGEKTQPIKTAGAIALVQTILSNIEYLSRINQEYVQRGENDKAHALSSLVGLNVLALKMADAIELPKIDVVASGPDIDKSKLN